MNWKPIVQLSEEWKQLKAGKISGTRFGQVISTRKNALLYELLNEKLNGYIYDDDYESEDMAYGRENESHAIDLLEERTGIKFLRGGVILSDFSHIHMASPDGVNIEVGAIAEVKCTMKGARQLQRFVEGPESDKMGQIINYFAQSDSVNVVYWASFCEFRPECELVVCEFRRKQFEKEITAGRIGVKAIEKQLEQLEQKITF